MYKKLSVLLLAFLLISCAEKKEVEQAGVPDYASVQLADKPNILWLVTEDMCPYIAPFGDSTVQTPNLSRLADEGVIYPNVYSVAGVCAPSRCALATGMYPSSIGGSHMRVNSYTKETGLPAYEAIPPADVRMHSECLRKLGYYCSNNYKTDYQFKHPVTAWDECGPYAHWRNRKEGQPFFAVFNFTETHESGLFEPYGFRHLEERHYHEGDRSYKWASDRMTEDETPVHLPKDTKFDIPPYLPDNAIVRRDIWKEYNNIVEMDKQVGAVLQQLEADGLLDNTIIFFYGDHGGPYPRQKRLVYDSGLHTPLIIRFPKKQLAGSKDDQLISFVDFKPTLLSLAGIEPPSHLQGQAFMGKYVAQKQRQYIYGAADRFDAETDAIRALRDRRFKYIRNFRPEQGYYLPVEYRERIPTMQELLRLRDAGKLNAIQAQWFRESKPTEELFDCENDPHEINNIAGLPEYHEKLVELRLEMDRLIQEIGDQPNLPERELIDQLWGGSDKQPVTVNPIIKEIDGKLEISCATQGASIGYRIVTGKKQVVTSWEIYENPIAIPQNAKLIVKAHRIGYLASKEVVWEK